MGVYFKTPCVSVLLVGRRDFRERLRPYDPTFYVVRGKFP